MPKQRRLCVLVLTSLLPLSLLADQVTLKNGDRVTGQIVKKDGDKLTVKTELMGEVSIPWSAVTSVVSSAPLVVVLPGGKSVNGALSTSEGALQVATPSGAETAPLAEVSAVRNADEQKQWERMQHPGLLDLWAGYVDLGLSLVRGNAETTTFATSFNAARVTRTDKTTLQFNEIYSTALISGTSASTAQAVRGGVDYNRNLKPRLFIDVFNQYEYDKFQDLDLRVVAGGGFGFKAVKSDRSTLDLAGGLDYERAQFSTPLTTELGSRATSATTGATNCLEDRLAHPVLPHLPESHLGRRLPDELRPRRGDAAEEMAFLAGDRQRPLSRAIRPRAARRTTFCSRPGSGSASRARPAATVLQQATAGSMP